MLVLVLVLVGGWGRKWRWIVSDGMLSLLIVLIVQLRCYSRASILGKLLSGSLCLNMRKPGNQTTNHIPSR